VIGDKTNVEGEKYEKFLVLLPNTIVHPGAVVVHLFDAPLAHRAVVCSLWLNTTALWAFEDNLPLLKPHSLNVLLGCISFGYSSRICEHCAQVRADSKESKALEYQPVDHAEHFVGVGVQDDTEDNELSIKDEKPCEEDTEKAADIADTPELSPHTPILIIQGGLHLTLKLIVEIKLNRIAFSLSRSHCHKWDIGNILRGGGQKLILCLCELNRHGELRKLNN